MTTIRLHNTRTRRKEAFEPIDAQNVRMVQGSHIVVKKLFDHDNAYIFQNADERIIFAIPFTNETTLIGTTDQDYEGNPRDAAITEGAVIPRSVSIAGMLP